MDTTTKLTQVEINLLLEEKEKKHFQSSYSFLNDHNGFRPGNLHLMLGVTSGGKSTFVRSLIIDILCNKPKKNILLWLSEETRLEFLTEFSYSSFNDFNNENFFIISEVDLGEMSKEDLIKKMEEIVFENDIDIVICDNLTTSDIYMDKGVEAQSEMAKQLKKMAVAWNIPLLVFMHTKAEITENYNNIINMNDVRGSKSIIALAQFLYILQNKFNQQRNAQFVRVTFQIHIDPKVI